jgi:hypothetical protein
MLDYSRGDEILQVGRLDMAAVWRSSWWMVQQVKRRLAQPARSHRRNRIE